MVVAAETLLGFWISNQVWNGCSVTPSANSQLRAGPGMPGTVLPSKPTKRDRSTKTCGSASTLVEKATLGSIRLTKRLNRVVGPTVKLNCWVVAFSSSKVKRTVAALSVGFCTRNQVSKGGWVEPSAKKKVAAAGARVGVGPTGVGEGVGPTGVGEGVGDGVRARAKVASIACIRVQLPPRSGLDQLPGPPRAPSGRRARASTIAAA